MKLARSRLRLQFAKGGTRVLHVTVLGTNGQVLASYNWTKGNMQFAATQTKRYGGPVQSKDKAHWAIVIGHNGVNHAAVLTAKAFAFYTAALQG